MPKSQERRLILFSIFSRCFVIVLAALVSHWIQPFDKSSYVAYNNTPSTQYISNIDRIIKTSLIGFGNWDGIYFLRISTDDYQFDQYHAFFPLLPMLTAFVRSTMLAPLFSAWLSSQTLTLLAAVLISNTCFVVATWFLYKLTLLVLRNASYAYWAAIMFCVNPASVFMSAAYTESLFAALAFGAMWAQVRSGPLATLPFLLLASLTRSNGAPLVAVIGHSTLLKQLELRPKTIKGVAASFMVSTLLTLPALVTAWLPLFAFEQRARSMFCDGTRPPELVPWCSSLPTGAALYGFIQKNYWNVGLFTYWELKQLPNFAIAAPIVVLSTIAIIRYFKFDSNFKRTITFGILGSSNSSKQQDGFYNAQVSSYMLHWGLLLVFGILFMYIQVLNRFLSSQCPPLYWFAADTLLASGKKEFGSSSLAKFTVAYFVLYTFIGTILFTSFYPWT